MRAGKQAEKRLETFFQIFLEELSGVKTNNEASQFAVDRQVQRAKKRARFRNNALKLSSIQGFLATNAAVGKTKVCVDPIILDHARDFILKSLERVTSRYDEEEIQNPLSVSYLYDFWRHGPGSSNGIWGTHTAEKLSQDMTCTLLCVPLVRKLRRDNIYFRLSDESNGCDGVVVVSGSRLELVIKNQDTMRAIAIEPDGNMLMQLAAGHILEDVLCYIGLDIRTQEPKNQALALSGSIDGRIATIDLKDASNMISRMLVSGTMPPIWYSLLEAIRSPYIDVEGVRTQCNMMSTMGNGFTFPLMTLIIVALIYGMRAKKQARPNLHIDWSQTAVYGDDIIVPVHEYAELCEVLTSAGLVVNRDKSYSDGPFRESCGGDYYNGVDVTPIYVQSLATEPEIYTVINQVLEWSAKVHVPLPNTLAWLKGRLKSKPFLVPEWMNPDQGVRTTLCSHSYNHLSVLPIKRLIETHGYGMMLISGGYVNELKPGDFIEDIGYIKRRDVKHVKKHDLPVATYTPRPVKTRYVTRTSRLPHGFLNGRDPLSRSHATSLWIDQDVSIIFAHV